MSDFTEGRVHGAALRRPVWPGTTDTFHELDR